MTPEGDIMTLSLKSFEDSLRAFFATVRTDLEQFASKFLPKIADSFETAVADLAKFAGQAVMEEAPKVISGTEKFGNAVTNLIQTVEAKGKQIAVSKAQQVIQTAYDTAVEVLHGSQK